MAHSRPASETGPRQLEIFEQEGVDPARVLIAHCGDTADVEYIERLLDRGAYVGLDRWARACSSPTSSARRRRRRCSSAATRSDFLSADSCATSTGSPPATAVQMLEAGMAKHWDIRIVPERVLPSCARPE